MQLLLVMPTNNLLKSSVSFFTWHNYVRNRNVWFQHYTCLLQFIHSFVRISEKHYKRKRKRNRLEKIFFFLLTSNSKLMESLFPPPPTTSVIITITTNTILLFLSIHRSVIYAFLFLKCDFLNSRRRCCRAQSFFFFSRVAGIKIYKA